LSAGLGAGGQDEYTEYRQHNGWQNDKTRQMMNDDDVIRMRIDRLMLQHGGLRAAATAIGLDAAYLSRLRSVHKTNPSDAALAKMGIRKVVKYVVDP
jgi:hypothetical protein